MKRVLIFSLAYYPSFVSGAEAAIKEITDRIDPADIEFHLITLLFDPKAPREERIGNVHVHRVGLGSAYLSKILFIPLAALKARSLDCALHFDAVWSMMTYMLFPAVFARAVGVKAPRILTLQDGDPYEKVFERAFIRPFAWILDYGFRTTAIVQVISSYLGTWPGKRGYRGPLELIYNGANPKNLKEEYSAEKAGEAAEKLGKKPGDVYLLNASRLVHQKANDVTLRALSLLPQKVHLVLIGEGDDRPMIESLARELKVENRLHLLGQMDRMEVPNYRNRVFSDIYVTPSRSEGLQLSSLSAMAGRLPLISTQAGGLAEYVWDKKHNPEKPETAWVVDVNAPEQIAAAVMDIMSNPEKVERVTETARAMVLESYDWDKIAVQMRQRVFAKVLGA
ncbi:MAG TPA: glycosyltransferase family 4 protein [Candidatus Paceibacterota bacterium]|nr:glycosyltransferase family 4 protein [Candidatus Paceibacterota bacterium]